MRRLTATLAAMLLAVAGAASAADTTPANDKLGAARKLVDSSQWPAAIAELQRVNDSGSADWNNLMGYSLRKSPTPDMAAAQAHYDTALRIDPKHRGALEYSGELYLMTGDLARAEARLAALDKACLLPCGEYRDLKREVERYKANGNRYLPTP